MRAARCRGLDLARQKDRDRREDQHDADHHKGVAEAQHQCLALERDRSHVAVCGYRRTRQNPSGHDDATQMAAAVA